MSRREIDAARRRNISAALLSLCSDPGHMRLAAQTGEALRVLTGDELELVERLVRRIISTPWLPTFRSLVSAVDASAAIVSRLLRGRSSYGELTIDSDPRDYELERDEELADAAIYAELLAMREMRQVGITSTGAGDLHLAALCNVGQHAQLPALVRNVQDRERPEPFILPPPWCLGSALLFQHSAVRIEHDAIVAVRCHHCGREWPLSSNELRLTGSGQYVIPTHEPAPDWRSLPPSEVG